MKNKRKSGVAVIIVLGLLALLMVLGVAFTVTMRGERAGAANYRSASSNRHLVWAGIARAIHQIDTTMGADLYPPGDYLASDHSAWNTNSSGVALLTRQARAYLPDAVAAFLDQEFTVIRSKWTTVGTVGRVAYLVVNLSDMLDVNHVGGGDRGGGVDPEEIRLSQLGLDVQDISDIVAQRPYPSLAGFRTVHAENADGMTDYFVTASRFLPDEVPEGIDQFDVSGTLADLESREGTTVGRGEISRAFVAIIADATPGMPREGLRNATLLTSMLFDYLDGSSDQPRNLEAPNLKKVPLLNEVFLDRPQLNLGSSSFRAALGIETWFPFVNTSDAPDVEIHCSSSLNFSILDPDNGNSITYQLPAPVTNDFVIDRVPRFENGFQAWVGRLEVDLGTIPAFTNVQTYQLQVDIEQMSVNEAGGGPSVDSAENVSLRFQASGPITAGGTADVTFDSQTYEVEDPRMNWDQKYWVASSDPHTGSARNRVTDALWTTLPHLAHAYPLHTTYADRLYSPLELGHLPVPVAAPDAAIAASLSNGDFAPWHSFRTFNRFDGSGNIVEPRHRMLAHFTINTNAVSRGLVNVNSLYTNVLLSAFADVPALDPEESVTVPAELAGEAVRLIVESGPYATVADILDFDWRQGLLQNEPDLVLNALVSYTTGLLGVRQNLFLIVASASAVGDAQADISMVRGQSSAMAIVWRDPVANEHGMHENFIRYFRWLD